MTTNSRVGSQIPIKIEKMAIGGAGIARHDGLVIFVALAAPEDELLVEITLKKKNFAEARIVEIIKPGPSRRTPPCPVANICGGCNWQQISDEEQRHQKENLVQETIKKFNRDLEFEYLSLKPSPRSFRYRNRIQPKFKNNHFGFFARNSHQIVEISDCPITEEPLTEKFAEVKKWVQSKNPAGLQKMEMYIADNEEIRYGLISDEDDGIGFSQVNRFQNPDLVATALDWAGTFAYKHVYDFYAGSGNFTFPFARKFSSSQITAVELNPKLVERGRSLSTEKRLTYFESDVETYLRKAKLEAEDLVLLDPPRAGTSEYIMNELAASQVKKIIYISCHPVSLARDLKWFFEAAARLGHTYKLTRVQAFEMFPQTDHVETIAELMRVDS